MAVSQYQMGVRMSDELLARVKAAAAHNKCPDSTLVRRILEERFNIVPKLEIPQWILDGKVLPHTTPTHKKERQRRSP